MKILNFGSCNIDNVFTQEHIVVPGETIAASAAETHPGGKGLNQSAALARAGAEVYHAGCIGADGEMLRADYPNLKTVMTLGSKGCVYFDTKKTVFSPAYKVRAVDTTAAGDTFTGYFIAETVKGRSVEAALKFACCAAALAVSEKGAASSIPAYAYVCAKIDTMEVNTDGKNEIFAERVNEYFSENYAEANLDGLSRTLGYSRSYTIRRLKKHMNTTFSCLLRDARCNAAAKLLRCTDLPVGEIIERTGYKNESFFRRAFTERYGMPPLRYRKSAKKTD